MMTLVHTLIKNRIPSEAIRYKIVLPDTSFVTNSEDEPQITVVMKHWTSLIKLFFLGDFGFMQDYINQKIDVDGDLRFLQLMNYPIGTESHLKERIQHDRKNGTFIVNWLNRYHLYKTMPTTDEQARYNAEFHYGHDPEFYDLYLGPTKAYSTGFWYPWTKSVEESQYNKWGLLLKKLRLEPGMKVASLGSGFGYGEVMAAVEYGVEVDCYNICPSQNRWLRAEINRRNLEHKIRVIDANYLAIGEKEKYYDRLLFIESIEHSGTPLRRKTIAAAVKALKDDGIGIIQWLSYPIESRLGLYIIRTYLYPGVEMPPLGDLIDDVVINGCEIQDLINGRRHYHYTLNAWYENFMRNWNAIVAINPKKYNEKFMRTWAIYLAGGACYLSAKDATARLFQLTFTKGTTDTYPMNRNFLYDESADDSAWVLGTEWVVRVSGK